MDYTFTHDAVADIKAHNAALEAAEMARWETQPAVVVAYYTDTGVTTWTGKPLGTIITSRVGRHNFGGRVISMRVKGSNGATYYGRASYDNGNAITLRKATGSKGGRSARRR